jgi:hypothetical protein
VLTSRALADTLQLMERAVQQNLYHEAHRRYRAGPGLDLLERLLTAGFTGGHSAAAALLASADAEAEGRRLGSPHKGGPGSPARGGGGGGAGGGGGSPNKRTAFALGAAMLEEADEDESEDEPEAEEDGAAGGDGSGADRAVSSAAGGLGEGDGGGAATASRSGAASGSRGLGIDVGADAAAGAAEPPGSPMPSGPHLQQLWSYWCPAVKGELYTPELRRCIIRVLRTGTAQPNVAVPCRAAMGSPLLCAPTTRANASVPPCRRSASSPSPCRCGHARTHTLYTRLRPAQT